MKNTNQLDDSRAIRYTSRDEDYREVTRYLGKSFKTYARAANRKARRSARQLLKNS